MHQMHAHAQERRSDDQEPTITDPLRSPCATGLKSSDLASDAIPRRLEVTRVATDGTPNACSLLYAAAWQATKALGYRRLLTYTQRGESGASLRAAGWRIVAARPPAPGWSRPSRPRTDHGVEHIARLRWQPANT